jgi:hypothetical protein
MRFEKMFPHLNEKVAGSKHNGGDEYYHSTAASFATLGFSGCIFQVLVLYWRFFIFSNTYWRCG